jgi:hypothetical protein
VDAVVWCPKRDSTKAVEEQRVSARTYLELHRLFNQAGVAVVPWSDVEELRGTGAEAMLVPWSSHFYPILYYNLGVDYAVTTVVDVYEKKDGNLREKVWMNVYNTRETRPMRTYCWWRTVPEKMSPPTEAKPQPTKM